MGNCLKTQLKESVNNDELPIFGGFIIHITKDDVPDFTQRTVSITKNTQERDCLAKVISGNIYFTDSTGSTNLGTEISIVGNTDLYLSNDDGKLLITNKYDIELLISNKFRVRLDELDYITSIYLASSVAYGNIPSHTLFTSITVGSKSTGDISKVNLSNATVVNLSNSKATGIIDILNPNITFLSIYNTSIGLDLSQLSDKTELVELNITYCKNIEGTFDLISNGSLQYIICQSCNVTGTVESFVEAEWEKNRRTGNTTIYRSGSNITFNGTNTVDAEVLYLIYDSSSVVVRNGSASGDILGTYNGSTWAYE